mmetsp:Transcript_143709/g.203299  ORF Transcript_143709/g.203299 Transcript_143709/m.203299 type:complete len:203 (-) Transcript_143709:253-861(-)
MARRQVNRAAVLPLAVAAVLACVTKFCAFTLPQPSSRRSDRVRLNAEGKCIGNCLQPDGSWKPTGEIDIQGPEEEALAQSVWEAFQEQYTGAAERGMYMDTPVGENDIKYRWRRLRDTFGITSEEAVGIMQTDALPLVIDADYVQKTFKAMVDGADRDKALEIVIRHPGILAAGPDVKDNMLQADLASNAINAARSLGNLFR